VNSETATNLYEIIEIKDLEIQSLKQEVEKLTQFVLQLKKQVYGGKSEKGFDNKNQIPLFSLPEPVIVESEKVVIKEHTRERNKRGAKYNNLPIQEEIITPEITTCECCQSALTKIGEEITEQIEHQPEVFIKKITRRPKLACTKCKEAVFVAPLPPSCSIIPKSFASASLLTHIVISKYCDHLPLYRQEQIFERKGFELTRKTMCEWIMHIGDQLKPVAEAIKKELLKENYLHADETPIKVQDLEQTNNIKQGYLWTLLGNPGVYYEYHPSRASTVVQNLLGDYSGYLQCDDYAAYNVSNAKRLGCMAHARRKFKETPDTKEKNKVLLLIAELYHIETTISKKSDEEKLNIRQDKSKKALVKLKEYLEYLKTNNLTNSIMGNAVSYSLNQWNELCLYTENAKFNIDNNPVERQMKAIAVGKKNWLFAGSHKGARVAGVFYTLINSAKNANVNPSEYLKDLMTRIQTHPINQINDLIPINWVKKFKAK